MGKLPGSGIRAWVRSVVRWWKTDGENESGEGTEDPLFEELQYDPDEIGGRTDIHTELGMDPAEFVRRILKVEGGRIRQRDFENYGDFSPSTICRLLQDLEEEGVVERYRAGREKIVMLPEETDSSVVRPDSATDPGLRGRSGG